MKKLRLLLCLASLVACTTISFAQGSLQGLVTDSATAAPLVGANVFLVGTSIGGTTDIDGHYKLVNVPEGRYTLRVSYIGYTSKVISISIRDDEATALSVMLSPQEIRGREVVVTAQMKGQLAAINQQVSAKTIVNVVSEEKIQELPDANAAESIGRLPGVSIIRSGGEASRVVLRGLSSRFSNITIDGVSIPGTDSTTRDVDLSMISQGSLAGIEVYKALLPDQDGDAIAGTINLVTKKAPSERLLRFDLRGNYNRLMNSAGQYDVSGRYGERFFDDVIGLQLQGNIEQKIRSREDVTYGYRYSFNPSAPNYDPLGFANDYNYGQLKVDFTDELRKRNGGQMILDVNTPDSGSVKLSGLYSRTQRQYNLYDRVYPGGSPGIVWDYDYRTTEQATSTTNASLQGKNFFAGFQIDWCASYADSRVDDPFDYEMIFNEPAGAKPDASLPSSFKDHPELFLTIAANNYAAAACSSAVYYQQQNFQRERTAFLNISRKYSLADFVSGELKGGGKYKARSRWMNRYELDDNSYLHGFYATDSSGSPIVLTGTRFEDYLNSRSGISPELADFVNQPATSRNLLTWATMSPLIDVNAMKLWYNLNKNGVSGSSHEYNPNAQAILDDYGVDEAVTAGYLMNTFDFGQEATLITGVRVEREQNDYIANFSPGGLQSIGTIISAPSGIVDTTTTHTETIWLPNAQLILRPSYFLTFRLAAYRALARPDYNLRLPQFILGTGGSSGGGQAIPLTLGNPNLRDAKAWNFELNSQLYTGITGLFTVSAFFKRIDDFYHQMVGLNVSEGFDSLLTAVGVTWQNAEPFKSLLAKNSNYALYVPYNSNHPTYVWGLEFEHQLSFNFLPGFLSNLVLSYNLSLTKSQTYIVQTQTEVETVTVVVRGVPRRQAEIVNVAVDAKRLSENQPYLYGNAALGYDLGGFSARLSVFYQGDYVQQYSPYDQSDIHVKQYMKWDLALRQQLSSVFSLYLNVDNITNIRERTSYSDVPMSWDLLRTEELYGTSADFGVRISI
ncbi:MAG TPA: TonB-dependent receptor [Candidatus Kryptonia bacterium]